MDELFAAPIGALLIGLLRVIDVSMATTRMILSVRGRPGMASFIAFFEVIIWVVAVGHALKHVDSFLHIAGYASGFAAGNYLGVWIEGRLAIGINVVHAVIVRNTEQDVLPDKARIVEALRENGYAVTEQTGQGHAGEVDLLHIVVRRKKVGDVIKVLKHYDPDVFITIEDVRTQHGGYMRPGGRKSPALVLK